MDMGIVGLVRKRYDVYTGKWLSMDSIHTRREKAKHNYITFHAP